MRDEVGWNDERELRQRRATEAQQAGLGRTLGRNPCIAAVAPDEHPFLSVKSIIPALGYVISYSMPRGRHAISLYRHGTVGAMHLAILLDRPLKSSHGPLSTRALASFAADLASLGITMLPV